MTLDEDGNSNVVRRPRTTSRRDMGILDLLREGA
jgi:hypothetical protein